jgi:hypothetical protein
MWQIVCALGWSDHWPAESFTDPTGNFQNGKKAKLTGINCEPVCVAVKDDIIPSSVICAKPTSQVTGSGTQLQETTLNAILAHVGGNGRRNHYSENMLTVLFAVLAPTPRGIVATAHFATKISKSRLARSQFTTPQYD